MTDNDFLTAMHITPDIESDIQPQMDMQAAATRWCQEAKTEHRRAEQWKNAAYFLGIVAGLLLSALVGVCSGGIQ